MSEEERARLWKVRLDSKRGRGLSAEDQRFCWLMFEKDPEGYRQMDKEIQEEVSRDFRF